MHSVKPKQSVHPQSAMRKPESAWPRRAVPDDAGQRAATAAGGRRAARTGAQHHGVVFLLDLVHDGVAVEAKGKRELYRDGRTPGEILRVGGRLGGRVSGGFRGGCAGGGELGEKVGERGSSFLVRGRSAALGSGFGRSPGPLRRPQSIIRVPIQSLSSFT